MDLETKGRELQQCRRREKQLEQSITKDINKLQNPFDESLLSFRLLNGLTFSKISEKLQYDERHIRRLYKKAIKSQKEISRLRVRNK